MLQDSQVQDESTTAFEMQALRLKLKESEQRMQALELRRATEFAVTQVLIEMDSIDEATPRILEAICRTMDWEWSALWVVDLEAEQLRCVASWYDARVDYSAFEARSRESLFPKGTGLLGTVWLSGEPRWIPDIQKDTDLRSTVAVELGLHSALALAIKRGKDVVGVMEFFSHAVREPDPILLHMVGQMGSQIGQFMARREVLGRSVRRTEMILNSAADGIYGIDIHGQATFVNPAAAVLTGHNVVDLLGHNMHEIMHHTRTDGSSHPVDEFEECQIFASFKDGQIHRVTDEVFWKKDGTSFPVEYVSAPILEGGQVVGSVVTFRDISERKAMERMRDQFVSVVSHELRTPLTSIRGSLGLIAAGRLGALSDKAQHMLNIAVNNTDRLVRLINDILDMERMKSGMMAIDKRICDAALLAEQAVEGIRGLAEKAGVVLSFSSSPASILADPDRVIQMLTNLLGNAIKFSPTGGHVSLTGEIRRSNVMFTVRDNGRGIPVDKLETIFESFLQVDQTDSRGRNGLGLTICRSIAVQHGGRVWAQSEMGQGSSFFVVLPLHNENPQDASEEQPGSGGTVSLPSAPALELVVDVPDGTVALALDRDPSGMDVLQALLEERGYRVIGVTSGRDAVAETLIHRTAAIMLDLETTAKDVPRDLLRKKTRVTEKPALPPSRLDRKPTVLLVEDDLDLAQVLLTMLQAKGIDAHHAQSGREAIQKSQSIRPDLVILDLVLPEGDGFVVVDWLRHHDVLSAASLIVYSGQSLSSYEREYLRLGQTVHLTKGKVTHLELEERVMELLRPQPAQVTKS